MAVVSAPGAAGGLWTHTPCDWRGNDPAVSAKPSGWPTDAVLGQPGLGTRPGPAMPSGITATAAAPGSGSATITWTTGTASDSNVDIGLTANYGIHVYDNAKVTSHSVTISGLAHTTLYHYRVSSHGGGYSAVDIDRTVTPT